MSGSDSFKDMKDRCIATSADSAYFPALMALLRSLRRSNPGVPVIVFDGGLSGGQVRKAGRFADIRPAEPFMDIPGRGKFSYIGRTTLLKFQVVELEYEKVLYLDADTVVRGDISDLFRLPRGRVGAVKENTARGNIFRKRDRPDVMENIDIDWEEKAFNAGVFVLRPSEWPDMKERASGLVSRFGRDVFSRSKDQQLLNIIFAGSILELPGRFNFSPFYDDSCKHDPVIIHYLTGTKPWHYTYPRGCFYREFRRHIRFWEYPPLFLVDLMRMLRYPASSGIMI